MDRDDEQLLAESRAGKREALEELLARHQRRIYRFGLEMCRDEEDAKDVLQDTLLAMARGIRDFRGQSSVSTWLYTIARSFCIKKRRRGKFAPVEERRIGSEGEEAAQVSDPARPADETLAGRQVEQALEAAIGSLDPMYREVLLLRDVEGLTAPEVAQVLGVSVDAVKSRLHRARVAVRQVVAPLLGIPEPSPPEAPAPCPDVVELFSRHLEGEISSDLCATLERHLAGCPRCTARCDSLRATLTLCSRSPAPAVPPSVQHSVRQALQRFLAT